MALSYSSAILVRPLAKSGADSFTILAGKFVAPSAHATMMTHNRPSSAWSTHVKTPSHIWFYDRRPDIFCSAVRYCGITFSYTAVSILLNYSKCPHPPRLTL